MHPSAPGPQNFTASHWHLPTSSMLAFSPFTDAAPQAPALEELLGNILIPISAEALSHALGMLGVGVGILCQ